MRVWIWRHTWTWWEGRAELSDPNSSENQPENARVKIGKNEEK